MTRLLAREHALPRDIRVIGTRRWSMRFSRRGAITSGVLFAVAVALLIASLMVGEYVVTPAALWETLAGRPPERLDEFFVLGRRLPRAMVALTVGASLGVAGAIFQTLTRNPLASPDVIGITSGASVGAITVLLVWGGTLAQSAIGALAGGIAAAIIIVLLTVKSGLHGVQLILTGVALSAIAMAVVDYVLSQVFVASAATAQSWLVGSLQGRGWSDLLPALGGLILTVPLIIAFASDARMLGLGDSVATALGVRAVRARWVLLTAATVLVSVAVATAGPISFIALVAPHIARRVNGGTSFVAAGLVGAILLAGSDLVAQYLFSVPLPVGAVTMTVGGAFFLWLLWREGAGRV